MDTAGGKFPNISMHYLPRRCMHCAQAPCLEACPLQAIYQRDDGIVLIDGAKCNGCQNCISACPYELLSFNPETNLVEKCSMCSHRVDQDLEPFCVLCCEGQAMYFGDLSNPASQVSKLIASKNANVLLSEAKTDPAVYYCPPKSPRGI
ncbi:4Fe-4S dicluster domain-containing protein [Chloroflexota bacterium]